ncbi:MAG TPA: hypothetical protein VNW94_28480 [Streptosporangiaceae bacterium]|jgi:hypothetical protein|nr:hypothetical protein [Actinomycetes bacterium]HXA63103.1 hypothetical protein [Streptosporangiaceae bacterium]
MKKYLKWGGIGFVVWYLVAKPHQAASVVHGMINGLAAAANSLGQFVSSMP